MVTQNVLARTRTFHLFSNFFVLVTWRALWEHADSFTGNGKNIYTYVYKFVLFKGIFNDLSKRKSE